MKNHKSSDPELRKKGILRILEIGPGPGYNFEFYPPNSELTVVEVNPFFEDQFYKKQADHPHIKLELHKLDQSLVVSSRRTQWEIQLSAMSERPMPV